jgi:hypothetical protein
MAEVNIPCVQFPALPEIPSIELLGGVKISGFLDFSQGMANQCSVNMSLMQQLAPLLASLAPVLQILGVIKALADFASNPLVNGPDLIIEINKVAKLFISLTPAGMAVTIAGILRLIIAFLHCFIVQLEAALEFQANIARARASLAIETNLVLEASLSCAEVNAKIAIDQTMGALGPIGPLLDVVSIIGGIAGISLSMPALDSGGDPAAALASVKGAIEGLDSALKALPI